jgi:hypothetical protein
MDSVGCEAEELAYLPHESLRLCSLPLETLRGIFEFLESFEIGILDNAMTNKIDRKRFLDVLDGFSLSPMMFFSDDHHERPEIQWCISRRIVFTSLRFESMCPCFSELFERTFKKINEINVDISDLEAGSPLYSLIGKCLNLSSLTFSCPISDCDLEVSLRNVHRLQSLEFYSCHSLTSASLETIVKYCPQLESLSLSSVSCVTDEYLSSVLERLPNLKHLSLYDVNISDQSIRLIVEANRLKEIIHWNDCREVSWEAKLFYLREINLPQLLSEDESQQANGMSAFIHMIGFCPNDGWIPTFPIGQYISMGLLTRIREIISNHNEEFYQSEFITSVICFFDIVVILGYFNHIIDSTDLIINLNLTRSFTNDSYWNLLTESWLQFFMKISKSHSQDLISQGILSKLMRLQREGQLVRKENNPFSTYVLILDFCPC